MATERGTQGLSGGPPGLQAINNVCASLYSDQPNPLQVTALVKYWLGGPDPLDYVSMYHNSGDGDTPPHWHYITCGFSDLHGDGRVHEVSQSSNQPSGYGFELTFRLLRDKEKAPPTWPAELLQCLARYVFSSDNVLCVGDHISWHKPLDSGDSRIQHMLLISDPQLHSFTTELGNVGFIQVVGVTGEELAAAQKWNGTGVLQLMKRYKITGGQHLVTNMRRGESLFDLEPTTQDEVDEGVCKDGSNLSGVSAVCGWEDGLGRPGSTLPIATNACDSHMMSMDQSGATELDGVMFPEEVHLKFNSEAAHLIPLAIRGRLRHGRHFTFKSFSGDSAITLVGGGIEGSLAREGRPLAAHGPWLQVYIGEELGVRVLSDVEKVLNKNSISLPHTMKWTSSHLSITIVPNDQS